MAKAAEATLLIVEDDGILAAHLESTVRNLGYTVLGPVATGEEAFALLQDNRADMLLMDIELAGQLNGVETATILAERTDIPVIFITGFSHDPLLEQAKRTTPYGYLIKPVNERDLAATITMTLHRHALDQELKESRVSLAESEARYRQLFEKAPVGIFCTTLTGTILLANQEMASMLGWQSPQAAIAHYTDLARQVYFEPDVRAKFIAQLQTDGEVRRFEFAGRKKNGEHIWISIDARLSPADGMLEEGGPQVIDGFARDITAQKRAEQALEESEYRHRQYMLSTPYGVFAVDASGRYLQVNPSACHLTGYAEHELLTMTIADLHFEADRPAAQTYFDQLLRSGKLHRDLPFRRKDGARRWFNLTAVKITDNRFLGFCNDITEKKQAEEALRANETLFRRVFEHHAAIKLLIDPDTGEIIDANEAASAYYGWSRDQLRRMRMADINTLSPEALQDEMEHAKLAQRNHFEFCHRLANGSIRDVEVYSSRIHANNRTFLHFIIHDITERKRAEAENKHLQAQLVQAQKLEAIGTLAGGIAHDFNNILGAVIGYADMARDSVAEGSVVARDLNQILKAGHRAKDLVKQILAFSRQADTEPTVFYPALIAKEAVKLLRPSLPTTIAIKAHIDSKAGPVRIDPTLFHQVVMNLCTNAFHAMEATGGTLDISLTTVRIDNGRQAGKLPIRSGDYVRLTIKDTGIGIAPEIQERIFDPFYTTKEAGKGTGMGLAIVHGIIIGGGGFITLDSTPDKGSVFHIHLPVVAETSTFAGDTVETVPAGSEHILFIDDEDLLVEMTSEILERLGYRVTVRTSSLEALTTFQNQPDRFDLVITDQTMPGMTGTDLARRMLQIRPDLPIILCTGYSTLISEEKAKALGIRAFLLKPLARKDLAHLIRKVLTKA